MFAAALLSSAFAPDPRGLSPLQQRLQAIADAKSEQYECKISIAMQTSNASLVASDHQGDTDAKFVWGSITKQLTGANVLQAAAAGKLGLGDRIAPRIDPFLASLGLPPLSTLFGASADAITVEQLATMRSGIPDFDTAKGHGHQQTDPFRAQVYAAPATEHPPQSLINESWVANGSLLFEPGTDFKYSSTNFAILGLLLASLDGVAWDALDQAKVFSELPAARRALYKTVTFAQHGSPASVGAVAGYDRTSYNGHDPSARPGVPVGDVAGVFSGFTASDLTASVGDVARLGYDLFGKAAPHLAPPDLVAAHMVPGPYIHYAFATFNLTTHGLSGADRPYYHTYGHLGATYGYDSLLAYFPGADVALAVASDIETDTQVQPADTMCFAYAAVLADLTQTEEPSCTYTAGSYHGGKCECVCPGGGGKPPCARRAA